MFTFIITQILKRVLYYIILYLFIYLLIINYGLLLLRSYKRKRKSNT